MPVVIQPYHTDSIWLAAFSGHITAAEHNTAMMQVINQLNQTAHPISLIVDWPEGTRQSYEIDILARIVTVVKHKNMDWIAAVGPNSTFGIWIAVLSKITEVKYKVFSSVEEAVQFLTGSGTEGKPT